MTFTTRPEIRGTFGVVTSTHWIASSVGFGILEKGGNAFDAAVAAGLVLQVVEPHLNGPAGDLPAILYDAEKRKPEVLCAQGTAPAAASIEHFEKLGLNLIPGSGLLATVIPGAFDGWMLMLQDYGLLSLREVLEPAIDYAKKGHPILPRVSYTIEGLKEFFTDEWPSSAEVWTPDGKTPAPNTNFKNPYLADTYQRILDEAEAESNDRSGQISAAREIWRNGFVADAICNFLSEASVMDVSEQKNSGILVREDLANWQATIEDTTSIDYHGWRIHKTQPWSQGPVMLQALSILKRFDLDAMDPNGEEFIHTVIEVMKLAYADRETYYGDPDFTDVPLDYLLSDKYAAERSQLIGEKASFAQRPGHLPGFEHLAEGYIARAQRDFEVTCGVSAGEPTMAHLTEKRGDTVHLDVIDRWGNMVAATPSGGWLQSSPVVPGLGFPLNSRAQMFWLEEGVPNALAPGKRPRTTLTPSFAEKDGMQLVFGTPGGDQQDQWQLIWFLRFVHHGLDLQEGMDCPLFHTNHFQSSFYPREVKSGEMTIEPAVGQDVIDGLRARGHVVTVAEPWSIGRLTAALRHPCGMLQAAATPRLMQAYAVGR